MDVLRIIQFEEADREEEENTHSLRIFADRSNPLEMYDDRKFLRRFRLSKETTMGLIEDLTLYLERPTARSNAIPVALQVCAGLRFFATGSFQVVNGDMHGLSQPTISRIVGDVIKAVCLVKGHIIRFRISRDELRERIDGMEAIAGMPGIIGGIDGTHIPIANPGGPQAQRFINRKGWHSLNCMVICDYRMRFMNMVCRWYGSAHDSRIFQESQVCRRLETGDLKGKGFLLGDARYQCTAYMFTLLRNPRTGADRKFNKAHKSTKNVIERCFGVYKKRFPSVALGNTLRLRLNRNMGAAFSTSCLHNIAIEQNDPLPDDNEAESNEDSDGDEGPPPALRGTVVRRRYIDANFN